MNHYNTVLFDLDGTLLDTLDDLTDALNDPLQVFGYPLLTRENMRDLLGQGIGYCLCHALPGGEEDPHYAEVLALFSSYYQAHGLEKTQPYPGMVEVVQELAAAGYQMAVVSNKQDKMTKRLIARFFSPYIQVALGERAGIPRKPDRTAVREALALLGAEQASAVYVGDSEVDIKTAANSGLDYIAVCWGFKSRAFLIEQGAQPARIVANAKELLHLL